MDLTYENMFASCNGEATIILDDEHCGHRKNNWFRDDMLSPTDAEVEKVFKYSANGKISAVRNRPSSNVAQDILSILRRFQMKKVLITGITGQDGSYLAEFLLENNR